MLRRMRPSRNYMAQSSGEVTVENVTQPQRRYQKRRLTRESREGSGGSAAAVVSRRRPLTSRQTMPRDRSSSPPSNSGRTDTDGDTPTVRGSSSSQDWADVDVS